MEESLPASRLLVISKEILFAKNRFRYFLEGFLLPLAPEVGLTSAEVMTLGRVSLYPLPDTNRLLLKTGHPKRTCHLPTSPKIGVKIHILNI